MSEHHLYNGPPRMDSKLVTTAGLVLGVSAVHCLVLFEEDCSNGRHQYTGSMNSGFEQSLWDLFLGEEVLLHALERYLGESPHHDESHLE